MIPKKISIYKKLHSTENLGATAGSTMTNLPMAEYLNWSLALNRIKNGEQYRLRASIIKI
jgi:hypothetical protein